MAQGSRIAYSAGIILLLATINAASDVTDDSDGVALVQAQTATHRASARASAVHVAQTERGCPPEAPTADKECTLIVIFNDTYNKQQITDILNNKTFQGLKSKSVLEGVDEAELFFGKNNLAGCCGAFDELQTTDGVTGVDFDAPVHMLE
mmetsp:Transcript_28159/g.49115  ORF Transcript_28159/g.49115 Transcript_28159/m.49115 type:complete len:150 (+) Transcript_28159:65-514(+)